MIKDDILKFFKTEEYDKAVLEIKKVLKENSDNGELFYYLFLAENKDYSNMNINNILSEVNFNKALELSNGKFKSLMETEYRFYKKSDVNLRKLLCDAKREKTNEVLELIKSVNDIKIPTKNDEFLDDLEFIVGESDSLEFLKLNLYVLNLIYALSKEQKLKPVINDILDKIVFFDKRYSNYKIVDNKKDLLLYIDKINNDKNEDKVVVKKDDIYVNFIRKKEIARYKTKLERIYFNSESIYKRTRINLIFSIISLLFSIFVIIGFSTSLFNFTSAIVFIILLLLLLFGCGSTLPNTGDINSRYCENWSPVLPVFVAGAPIFSFIGAMYIACFVWIRDFGILKDLIFFHNTAGDYINMLSKNLEKDKYDQLINEISDFIKSTRN